MAALDQEGEELADGGEFPGPGDACETEAGQMVQEEQEKARQRQLLKAIQSGSVVTWSHVHLQGEHDFSEEKMQDSVGFNFSQILAFKLDEKWEE